MRVYSWPYKVIKESLSFVPAPSFPFDCSFCFFSFPCAPGGLHSSSAFHGIQGNAASSQCWCALVQDPMVWGGHASPLRKAGAWRDPSTLIACQNTQRSQRRRLGEKQKKRGQKSLGGNSRLVDSHTDPTSVFALCEDYVQNDTLSSLVFIINRFRQLSSRFLEDVRCKPAACGRRAGQVGVNPPLGSVKRSVIDEQTLTQSCV